MKKYEITQRIEKEKIISIVRSDDEEGILGAVGALLDGGLSCVEVPLTVPFPHTVLEKIARKYANSSLLLGAGTVLDSESARIAILSGAKYLVTPTLNREVMTLANRYGVPVCCGIATATEALTAAEAGAEWMKLFPASQYSPSIIKDIKAPLPHLQLVPTGGIGVDNIRDWLQAGAVACGVGGSLLKGIGEKNYAQITKNAKEFLARIKL